MIPLVLLAGFLGSGKTRLLTDLIPQLIQRGTRVRVILNDFENATIDASRLGALDALVTPLNGECVCCGSLRELLQHLYDVPADPGSVMLIEANGATETDELLAHLTSDGRLAHYTLPLQVTVIDAARWQKRWWHNGLERAQATTATHLFLNWTSRLSDAKRDAVQRQLRALNGGAQFVTPAILAESLHALAAAAKADPRAGGRPLSGPSVAPSTPTAEGRAPAAHTHPFGSASLPLPDPVQRAAFLAFVQGLPIAVVRAKGLVRFADKPGEMFVWHRVPGRRAVRLDRSHPHDDAQPTALFIGVGMPMDVLVRGVAAIAG